MDITLIKRRADELLETCKPQMIRNITLLMLIGLVPSLFDGDNALMELISFILLIVFLTFEHGYVVSSLKVVRNNAQNLSDDDVFVGFRRWKELFPTYLVSSLVLFGVTMISAIVLIVIFMILFGSAIGNMSTIVLSNLNMAQSNPTALVQLLIQYAPSLVTVIMLVTIIMLVIIVVFSVLLFAMPYLLEQYGMTTTVALKESVALMKGHIWDMIKLELSFLGWMILVAIVQGAVEYLLSFIPVLGSMIAAIAGVFVAVYTYMPRYVLSQAIFFEELAYYRYDGYQQSDQGDIYSE